MACECNHPFHFIEFVKYDEEKEVDVQIVVDTAPFWYRVKSAFNHIFKNDKIFLGDMILNENNVKKLHFFLDVDDKNC